MNAAAWVLITLVHGTMMAVGPYPSGEACATDLQTHEIGICLPRGHPLIRPPDSRPALDFIDDVMEILA